MAMASLKAIPLYIEVCVSTVVIEMTWPTPDCGPLFSISCGWPSRWDSYCSGGYDWREGWQGAQEAASGDSSTPVGSRNIKEETHEAKSTHSVGKRDHPDWFCGTRQRRDCKARVARNGGSAKSVRSRQSP